MEKYRSDIYIMFPVDYRPHQKNKNDVLDYPVFKEYMTQFYEQSEYECSSDIAKHLKREFIGEYLFACTGDDYSGCEDEDHKLNKEYIKGTNTAYLYSTVHESTNLSIITMVIPNNYYSVTNIQDQMTTGHLYISNKDEEEFYNIDSFFTTELDISRIDEPKCIVCLKDRPADEVEMKCILACEAFQSDYATYQLKSQEMEDIAKKNIAQYDFYEAYASSKCVLFIFEEFKDNYIENISSEITLIFICELVLMQNVAIMRTNKHIIECLTNKNMISLKEIENLYSEFGNTIIFWNIDNFKYTLSQILFEHIHIAFKNPQLLGEYERNQAHLEHIVELKNSQSAEREGKVINFIATALAIIQVIPMLLDNSPTSRTMLGSLSGLFFIAFILMVSKHNRTRQRNKRRK